MPPRFKTPSAHGVYPVVRAVCQEEPPAFFRRTGHGRLTSKVNVGRHDLPIRVGLVRAVMIE